MWRGSSEQLDERLSDPFPDIWSQLRNIALE